MTEIRVLDTYWSDHCRHTTFSTELTDVNLTTVITKSPIEELTNKYLADSEILQRKRRQICLPDGSCTDGYEETENRRKIAGSGRIR